MSVCQLAASSHSSRVVGKAGDPETRLAVCRLESLAGELIEQSIAPSTRRSHSSAQTQYMSFRAKILQPPLPTTEQILIQLVAGLLQRCCHSTACSNLSAVCHLNLSLGYPDSLACGLFLAYPLPGPDVGLFCLFCLFVAVCCLCFLLLFFFVFLFFQDRPTTIA